MLLDVGGQDATEAFEDVGHSDEARGILQGLLIGDLKRKVSATTTFPYYFHITWSAISTSTVINVLHHSRKAFRHNQSSPQEKDLPYSRGSVAWSVWPLLILLHLGWRSTTKSTNRISHVKRQDKRQRRDGHRRVCHHVCRSRTCIGDISICICQEMIVLHGWAWISIGIRKGRIYDVQLVWAVIGTSRANGRNAISPLKAWRT